MPTFTLLTLNCFGVPTPATRRRLLTLAAEFNRRDACVVCLQEVQAHAYRRLLTQACADYPAHACAPFVHAPKGGLLTLSRLPIEQTRFTLYRERGLWYTPSLADWILHKGILRTDLALDGIPIVVLNTHLTANYHGDWSTDNRYARVERAQLQQLAEAMQDLPAGALALVAGDFNVPRGSWLYEEFLEASGLRDPLAGDMRPTYRAPPGISSRYAMPIDFALLRAPRLPGLAVQSDLRFREKLPLIGGGQAYLSDHLGVELRVSWASDAAGSG